MNMELKLTLIYLAVISFISMLVTVSDKRRARKHKWRVMESTLLILSALGGSVAMLLTMLVIRHKTRHIKFMLGIPVIIVIQLVLVYYLWSIGLWTIS